MADRKQDEYKHVKFYAENTKAKQAGFSKFEEGGEFYFCRYIDGKIAMLSQAYTSAAGRDNGIESVKKNEKLGKRYVFETRGAKAHGFGLKAGNGQEIAISPDYASLSQAENVSGRLTGKTASKKPAPKKAAAKPKAKKAAPKKPAKAAAATAAFTSADQRIENYKPLAFYKKHGGKADGFNSFEENGAHYFHYNEGGGIVLISESYTSKAGRDNGIASVKKNMKRKAAYQYHKHKNGKHYFDINAANHQEIATSRWYGSAAAATAGAAYLLGTRDRVKPKKAKPAAAVVASAAPAKAIPAKKAAAPKAKPVKTAAAAPKAKPVEKKSNASAAPLAAGVVAAGLGASAAKAKTNTVKKAAAPVKAAPVRPAPVNPAPVAAAPIAAAALGTVGVAGAAAMAAAPKPEAVAAATAKTAPIAGAAVSAAPAAAAVAEGGGIWGWLKWLLMALIALLAMFFLFKACAGGEKDVKAASPVTTTETAAPAAMVTCWNGSKAKNDQACPTKISCWDDSFATSLSACPAKPAPAIKTPAATTITSAAPQTTVANATTGLTTDKMSAPSVMGRICAPSSNPLFNVSGSTPKNVGRLGTNPQFGNSLTYSPDEFFRRLQVKYRTSPRDKSFLDLLARSLGYGTFANMDASMFSNDTLTKGTSGLLGFGAQHALQYSTLNVSDPTHLEAFKVRSANGTDVHFMKRCGNYMYVCQP